MAMICRGKAESRTLGPLSQVSISLGLLTKRSGNSYFARFHRLAASSGQSASRPVQGYHEFKRADRELGIIVRDSGVDYESVFYESFMATPKAFRESLMRYIEFGR